MKFRVYDAATTVHLEFRGQTYIFLNDTQGSRFLAALLVAADHFLLHEDAARMIGANWAGGSQNATLRQVKHRLNRWLRDALGPALILHSCASNKDADWVLCRYNKGYLLNPAVKFVPKGDSAAGYVSPGRRHDVGTWAMDPTKPVKSRPDDESAANPARFANPCFATPPTAWKQSRQGGARTSPLLKSIRSRPRHDV